LHAMMSAPDAFRGFIVLAAAIGDDQTMPVSLRAFFDAHPAATLNADMYLGMDDVRGMGLSRAYEVASILQQRAARVRDLRFTFRYYPNESHMSVPLRGVDDGLQAIFDGWELGDAFELYEQGGLDAIEKHFAALSERLGFPVAVPADTLFAAFNGLEGRKRYAEAELVIARAVQLHPQDTTALYYQARLQNEMGNKPLAVDTLRRALRISPNDNGARGLLRYMQVDPDTVAAQVKVSVRELAGFVGSYGDPVVFEVTLRGDQLYGNSANREYQLAPLSETRFHYSEKNVYPNGGDLTFRTDARGRVTGVVFSDSGRELAKSR
jgi:tetratricopeptide (TPR) repeat protein